MNKLLILAFLISLTCLACEKSLDYQVSNRESKYVLYSFPMADSTITVHTSLSTSIIGNASYKFLNNANLSTYINNKLSVSEPYPNNTEWYNISPYKGIASNKYDFIVVTENGDSISSNTTIPEAVPIKSIDILELTTSNTQSNNIKFVINFKDPRRVNNFYQLRIDLLSIEDGETVISTINYIKDDPVFLNVENENDILIGIDYEGTFDDNFIDGVEYGLKVSIPEETLKNDQQSKLSFQLYSLSEEYYRYIRSSIVQDTYRGTVFYEPTNIFSNVEGGIGVVAGLSVSKHNISINE